MNNLFEMTNSDNTFDDNKRKLITKTKGDILLVGSGLVTAKIEALLSKNAWKVTVAEDQKEFNFAIKNSQYPLVITVFSDDKKMLNEIEYHALAKYTTKWIAIIPNDGWLKRHANMRFSQVFYDYHRVPVISERFLDTVGHAYGMASLAQTELESTSQYRILKTEASIDEIIGKSKAIKNLRRMIDLVSRENHTVLLTGESGTGKELVARNIHLQSNRKLHPFITINCASMPESLIHAELFGHEKGAFPGATKRMIGKIEAADLGTIFIDKISDMPMSVQISLLNFFETRKIQRIGSIKELDINCCIVLSADNNLRQAVEEGRFREDLYHRINVIPVMLAPLKDRLEDIPLLARHFLNRFNNGQTEKHFSTECLQSMQNYAWPGNVRELMNKIKRALLISNGQSILSSDLGLESIENSNVVDLSTARKLAERKAILDALESTGNNHTLAAEKLGISRTSLYRLLAKIEEKSVLN